MPLAPLSFAQRAIARGVEAWCRAEGISASRATLASFGTAARPPTTTLLFNLADADVLIGSHEVRVRMGHRIAEFPYDPAASVADVIVAVTRVMETG